MPPQVESVSEVHSPAAPVPDFDVPLLHLQPWIETPGDSASIQLSKCVACGQEFPNIGSLVQHCRENHQTSKQQADEWRLGTHRCPQEGCSFTAWDPDHLRVHVEGHQDAQLLPFPCAHHQCPHMYVQEQHVLEHLCTHEGIPGSEGFSCEHCGHRAKTRQHLDMHMLTHGDKILECEHEGCEFRTAHPNSLQVHMAVQHGDLHLECPQGCGYRTSVQGQLNRHVSGHAKAQEKAKAMKKVRKFPCPHDECNFSTDSKRALKKHDRIHTAPFRCTHEGCKYKTAYKTLLERHIMTHTGERKFPCEVDGCDSKFKTKSHLKRHMKKVHKVM